MDSKELFVKNENNPILSSADWPYPIEHVFNPAAVKHNGETILLVRAEDRRSFSHLTVARSRDGITNWQIDPKPTLEASLEHNEFKKGLEDPRVVWVKELKQFIISCVSFREESIDHPYGISLISTKDFVTFERISKPLDPWNKNASLFPRKINGYFVLIHRPTVKDESCIAISFSKDLFLWQGTKILFRTREWYWDEAKIGLACPPLETKKGWIIFYHGSKSKANKLIYRVF